MSRTTSTSIKHRLDALNKRQGTFPAVRTGGPFTPGAFVLYGDACGWQVHEIQTEGGSIKVLFGGDTLREVATFLNELEVQA